MLGVFAEFETNLPRERQLEGIAKAKARGVYKGRPPTIDLAVVLSLWTIDGRTGASPWKTHRAGKCESLRQSARQAERRS